MLIAAWQVGSLAETFKTGDDNSVERQEGQSWTRAQHNKATFKAVDRPSNFPAFLAPLDPVVHREGLTNLREV